MNLFSYIFYRISKFYVKSSLETNSPEIYARGLTVVFQALNVVTLLYFLFSIKMTAYSWIYICILLYFFAFIFFNKKKLKKYQQRWDNENKQQHRIKGILVIAYLISTLFFFGLAASKMY